MYFLSILHLFQEYKTSELKNRLRITNSNSDPVRNNVMCKSVTNVCWARTRFLGEHECPRFIENMSCWANSISNFLIDFKTII